MRTLFLVTVLTAMAAVLLGMRFANPPVEPATQGPAPAATATIDPRHGRLVTLRVVDDLTATMGFPSGEHGHIVEENEIRNRVSHLTYGRYVKGALAVGIQGGSRGVIKDIGNVRLRSTEASVLPFLVQRDGTVFDTSREQSSLSEAGVALHDEARGPAAAEVHLGHVYLIRIDEANRSLFAAVRVVEHLPDQFVTLRWRML